MKAAVLVFPLAVEERDLTEKTSIPLPTIKNTEQTVLACPLRADNVTVQFASIARKIEARCLLIV
jgi:hypothetical protein